MLVTFLKVHLSRRFYILLWSLGYVYCYNFMMQNLGNNDLPKNSNEEIEEYMHLVEKEITMYQTSLEEAKKDYEILKKKEFPPLKLSEQQQSFLDKQPNYVEYLRTVKKFHEFVAIKRSQNDRAVQALKERADELVKLSLKEHFNL